MENIITALIQELNGSIFTLIAVLLVMFWVLYKVGGYAEKFSTSDTERKEVKIDIKEIRNELSSIGAMTKLLYEKGSPTVQRSSPIALTPLGEEIAKETNAEGKIAAHWLEIRKKLESKDPQNPYDIQTVSMDVARECFDEIFSAAEKGEIKTYAYNKGINLLEIYPVIGIIVRNKVFAERNIQVGDVDKHTPKA